jgi:hypothetical protein
MRGVSSRFNRDKATAAAKTTVYNTVDELKLPSRTSATRFCSNELLKEDIVFVFFFRLTERKIGVGLWSAF